MNDLYTKDRMERNNSDFDGCGIGSGHYTPQEDLRERIGESKLPLILLCFAIFCYAILIFITVQEISLYNSGTAVEAQISPSGKTAQFRDENGNAHIADISWANAKASDKTITVYYKGNDYVHAQPITSLLFYTIAYLFFSGFIAVLIFWLYKSLHKTKHSANIINKTGGYRSKFDE